MSCTEDDSFSDFAPPAKATKKPAAKAAASRAAPKAAPKARAPAKPKAKAALGEINVNDDENAAAAPVASKAKTAGNPEPKSIEETYQKKTQLEHILIRPDTYVGSIESQTVPMWVYEDEKMVHRDVTYVPGLYKIFDELIVNAADNKVRDPTMDTIKINIDKENNRISVYNTGRGIPIEMHAKEGVYVPELIFGHLLTSSNYNDGEKKITGGRNGYGAKLCNIFSTEFIVETADSVSGRKFIQTFTDNMSHKTTPRITNNAKGENYTRITFKPDLARFGMTSIDHDFEALVKKRAFDLAGCVRGIKVFLNDVRLKLKDFKDYAELYVSSVQSSGLLGKPVVLYESPNARWEIAFSLSDGEFQQVSFVNSVCTSKGGTHVDHVANQLVTNLIEAVKKKDKKSAPIKPSQAKRQLWVFVNCSIENPAFDSQTKETMTLKQSSFGSKCTISEDFIKKVLKSGAVDRILSSALYTQEKQLKKTDGTKTNRVTHEKLDDANNAGSKKAKECTLILTEGDSAKTLAISGLSVIGRDNFGVFPLRGKLLNVREASHAQIQANAEINAIKKIMGLKHGTVYDSVDTLRYGSLMIMADQDYDGSHIKGLIINLIDHFWPSLLKIPGFLVEFITPIVRVTKGEDGPNPQEHSFFTMPEYEQWKAENDDGRLWNHTYYKGLGSSDASDARKYFSDLEKHMKQFSIVKAGDRELIDMAFSKKKADERKEWLRQFAPGTYMDYGQAEIPLDEFVNRELILFSMADNFRSIPSFVDGLKPSQRKIMFYCFKKQLKKPEKVNQLVGGVAKETAYHHGDVSLVSTIIGLAQRFVGSNNVAVLHPCGQFGTRLQGGKDAASGRYISTRLSPLARALYCQSDDPLLAYQNEDGLSIEPEWYMPILPVLLLNGAEGIGTGWSTSIPNYNPRDVVDNLFRLMKDEEPLPMKPWYRGFQGNIEPISKDKFKVTGLIEKIDETTIKITELPIKCWTQSYKEDLDAWVTGTEKEPAWITSYTAHHTDSKVNFVIELTEEQMERAEKEGLEKRFKLVGSLSTSNLVCFDQEGRIKKYESIDDILRDFYDLRKKFYQKRKEYMLKTLNHELAILENKIRFVTEIIEGKLVVQNKKKAVLLQELHTRKYLAVVEQKKKTSKKDKDAPEEDADADDDDTAGAAGGGYDYLLKMPIWNLTMEKIEKLLKEMESKGGQIVDLSKKTIYDLWRTDLEAFLVEWDKFEAMMTKEESTVPKKGSESVTASKAKRKPAAKKKVAAVSDNDDDFAVKVEKPKRATKAPAKASKAAAPAAAATVDEITDNFSAIDISSALAPAAAKKRVLGGKKATTAGAARATAAVSAGSKSTSASSSPSSDAKAASIPKRTGAAATAEWEYDAKSTGIDDYMDVDVLAATANAAFGAGNAPAPAPKRAVRARRPAAYVVESDSDNTAVTAARSKPTSDSEDGMPVASVAKKSPPATAAASSARAKKAPVAVESETEEEEEDIMALAPKRAVAKAAAPAAAVASGARAKKTPVAVQSDTEEEEEEEIVVVAPKRAVAKAAAPPAARRGKSIVVSSEESDFDEEDDEKDTPPPPRASAAKSAVAKPAAKPAAKAAVVKPAAKPAAKAAAVRAVAAAPVAVTAASAAPVAAARAARRGKQPVKYVVSDDDEEDEEKAEFSETAEESEHSFVETESDY
ncbi:DNA topoisomerase 2 [Geranomyces variabilis]|uniref:DNA topoisomerase 2 n=1 Tax=Geranomyces variabilis TaxID=109894 RepID=A0AAD5XNR4_9FUNG|nr:DNA topoisomerase 2 [Geranomyces variabilis]